MIIKLMFIKYVKLRYKLFIIWTDILILKENFPIYKVKE